MELKYPFILCIGIVFIIILIIINFKKKKKYKDGVKIANTKFLKNDSYYNSVIKKYKILSYSTIVVFVLSIIFCFVLMSRPQKYDVTNSNIYNRDIFLCMDISTSVDELNEELVGKLKEVVSKMKGERFGISIFNTSSVVLVPLTDDYDYVLSVLDTLKESLQNSTGKDYSSDNFLYLSSYISSGTLVGNTQRGSSLIGDGLASCAYNFTNLDENRSRIIIFSTDNDMAGKPILSLQDAAQICKDKNIKVFGVAPDKIYDKDRNEFEMAVKKTGGNLYVGSKTDTVKNIVSSIESQEKNLLKNKKEFKKIDVPQIPFILLVISLIILAILNRKVNV